MLIRHQSLTRDELQQKAALIYPFLQRELFLSIEQDSLTDRVDSYISELAEQELIELNGDVVSIKQTNTQTLMLLGRTIAETLQRYSIALNLLAEYPELGKTDVEQRSQDIAQRLGRLHGINAPEFFDKGVFSAMFATLKQQGYLDQDGNVHHEKTQCLADLLFELLHPEIKLTIQESICQSSESE